MGRIPLPKTGNPKLDSTLRLIDEQLSELYSQHGQQYSRGTPLAPNSLSINNSLNDNEAMIRKNIYPDLQAIGMVRTQANGQILSAINMRSAIAGNPRNSHNGAVGSGSYRYEFIVPPKNREGTSFLDYFLTGMVDDNAAALHGILWSITTAGNFVFAETRQEVAGVITFADLGHYVVAFGRFA